MTIDRLERVLVFPAEVCKHNLEYKNGVFECVKEISKYDYKK